MSKKAIIRALERKGFTTTLVEYNRVATPSGMVPGWEIQLGERGDDLLCALGYDASPDCGTAAEVLDWIEGLPTMEDLEAEEHYQNEIDEHLAEIEALRAFEEGRA